MKKSVFSKFWGILAVAVLGSVLFTACPPEPKPEPGPGNDPELPAALKNTNWIHTDGDKVQFGAKNTVTVIPASGSQGTFTLKDSQTVSEANRTTLWFGSSQTTDFIVYQNNAVYSVVLGNVNKTNGGWSLDSGSSSGNEMSWTAVTDNPFSYGSIRAIAYGNGKFVAVGSGGKKMAYSSDGITWTAVTKIGTFTFSFHAYTIAWGNGMFVAGGSGVVYGTSTIANMMYSPDGTTWTVVTNSPLAPIGTTTDSIETIAYGNGKFVAGSYAGKMAYSSDGITWTAVTDNTIDEVFSDPATINTIAWGNGKFVAGGKNGKMTYSSDGITWTAVTDSALDTSEIYSIAWGNGKFVAGGENGKMAYSSDGITWTAVTNSVFGTSGIYSIAWGNDKFVAGGYDKMAYLSGD